MPNTTVGAINCDTVDYVQRYSPIILTQSLQFLLSYTSVFLIIGARAIQRHAYFHPNVKVLFNKFQAAIFMHGISMGTAQFYHIMTSFSFESCELLISCKLCFGFRLVITSCIIAFCLLISAIPIERTVATRNLGKGYENWKGSLGKWISLLVILISLLVSLCYHWPDLSNRTCIHCVYDYRDIFPPHLMHFLAAVCTVFLLMTLVLLLINHCKLRKKTYSLAIEFQINQNLRVLHLALPVSFWTFLAFFWWIGLSYFVGSDADLDAEIEQFHKMVQNIFPVYTFLTSLTWLLLMYIEKKKKRVGMVPPETSKVEKDMYFQSLNEQWSRMPSQTQKTGRLNLLNVFAVPRSSVAS